MFETVLVLSGSGDGEGDALARLVQLLAYGLERLLSGVCQVAESDPWDVPPAGHQSGTTTYPRTGQEVAA